MPIYYFITQITEEKKIPASMMGLTEKKLNYLSEANDYVRT